MSVKAIYYEHDFFEKALTALVNYLRELMKPYRNTLTDKTFPILIPNTGDEKFLFDEIQDRNVYSKVPRWDINILGVNNTDQKRTNPRENGTFTAVTVNSLGQNIKKDFSAPLARRPVDVGLATQVVFTNIFEYFRFVEIYLTLSTYPHVFTFYHAGRIHYAQFNFPELNDSDANVTFEFQADKRERKLPLPFVLQVQFPAYQIYGIPGTGNEGFNGDDGTGEGGGTDDVVSGPMLKIIHNLKPKQKEGDPDSLILTQIITKPIPDDLIIDDEDKDED